MASVIDYEGITNTIADGIYAVQGANTAYVGYSVKVSQERQFVPKSGMDPRAIYIIVSYGESTIDYGQSILPITISAYGESGTFEVARGLLSDFASRFNLYRDGETQQLWNMPAVVSPMGAIGNGYRALLSMQGVFVYAGPEGNPVNKVIYTEKDYSEEIDFLTFSDTFVNSLRPQPKSNSMGRAQSVSAFSTYTFGISAYMKDSQFFDLANGIKHGKVSPDTTFGFYIEYLREGSANHTMRLSQYSGRQETSTLYIATMTFSE